MTSTDWLLKHLQIDEAVDWALDSNSVDVRCEGDNTTRGYSRVTLFQDHVFLQ